MVQGPYLVPPRKVDDNHAGYYDYKRYKATLGKKWETERWKRSLAGI